MSTTTKKYKLFKYDTVADKNSTYNIDNALNGNWDNLESLIGISKYDATSTYAINDIVVVSTSSDTKLYKSLANDNIGNAVTNTTYWTEVELGGGGVEITYADSSTADLETVKYQTESTFASRTTFPKEQIEVVEYNGETPLYFANVQTISASTNYTFNNNGTFRVGSTSVATVTITDTNGNSKPLYGYEFRIPANYTFTSNQAGNFFFDNTYNGYLAGAVNNA